jgi:hypothetical protein
MLGLMNEHWVPVSRRAAGRPARYVSPEWIRHLRDQGLTFRKIARETGLGYGTVRRAYRGIPTTSGLYNRQPLWPESSAPQPGEEDLTQ